MLDPNGVIIDVGRRRRLFTGPLREALLAIVPTCRFPGCDRPALRSQVDHIDRYADHGPTHAANGQACCRYHNRLKEKGFRTIRGPDHTVTWHRPDGTRLE